MRSRLPHIRIQISVYLTKMERPGNIPKGQDQAPAHVCHNPPLPSSLPYFCPWSPVLGSPGLPSAGTQDCPRLGISRLSPLKPDYK